MKATRKLLRLSLVLLLAIFTLSTGMTVSAGDKSAVKAQALAYFTKGGRISYAVDAPHDR